MATEEKQPIQSEEEEKQNSTSSKINSDAVEENEAVDNQAVEIDPTEELKIELSEMEDKFLRAQAEIANMRNRFKKEKEDVVRYRSQSLGKELLPVVDNLERALSINPTEEHGENMKKGIEMVLESLIHAMKAEGIEEIKAEGEIFDPTKHQAVQTAPLTEGQTPEEIVQVLQKGYSLHDRILRPSMVIVAQ